MFEEEFTNWFKTDEPQDDNFLYEGFLQEQQSNEFNRAIWRANDDFHQQETPVKIFLEDEEPIDLHPTVRSPQPNFVYPIQTLPNPTPAYGMDHSRSNYMIMSSINAREKRKHADLWWKVLSTAARITPMESKHRNAVNALAFEFKNNP